MKVPGTAKISTLQALFEFLQALWHEKPVLCAVQAPGGRAEHWAWQRGSCSTYSSDWEDICSREALQDVKQNILGEVQERQDSRPFYYPSLWRERKTSGTSTVNYWKRKTQNTSVSERTAKAKRYYIVLHTYTGVHLSTSSLQCRTLQTH